MVVRVRTPADTLGRLDGFLTKKVQDAFGVDSGAEVLELTNGNWTSWVLRRPGLDDQRLGQDFRQARSAVSALCRAEYAKLRMRKQVEGERVRGIRRKLGRL